MLRCRDRGSQRSYRLTDKRITGADVALRFNKKKTDDDDAGDGGKEAQAFHAQPEKARGWFEHGRKAADPDYALTCFANGIRLDPSPMSAHEAMFAAAVKYTGKPAAGKDVRKIDGAPTLF